MFGTPFTLQVKRYAAGTKNARGNTAVEYASPVNWSVHSIVPGDSPSGGRAGEEPAQSNRDLSEIQWTILAPDDDQVPGERDLVTVAGVDYAVDGRPDRYGQASPWSTDLDTAVVRLRRTEG